MGFRYLTRAQTAAFALVAIASPAALALDCSKPKNRVEENQCEGQVLEKADKALNAAYGKLQAKLKEDQRTALRDAQRAWIKFRDTSCAFDNTLLEGSSRTLEKIACLTHQTEQRTKTLNAYAQDLK